MNGRITVVAVAGSQLPRLESAARRACNPAGRPVLKLPRFVAHLLTFLVVFIGWVFFRSTNLHDSLSIIGTMFGMVHGGHNGPSVTEVIWLGIALVVVLYAPNSLEIMSRVKPSWIWAAIVVLTFLYTVYHFDQTTEFLYYQF